MSRTYTTFQFIAHYFRSRRWDAFHSPFLFSLLTHCCDETITDPGFEVIEQLRTKLIYADDSIVRKDFGKGSLFMEKGNTVPVAAIARHALSLPFQCRFLYRLTSFLKPQRIVEFGTSLGISAAYLAIGAPKGDVVTIEGDPEVAARAAAVFKSMALDNISLHASTFEDYISSLQFDSPKIDLLFLDGHHTASAVMSYYTSLKHYLHAESVVVVDDIYWSPDMQEGWKKMVNLPEVSQSIDCFHFGLLFFKPDFLNKENHVIRLPLKMVLTR
jgi:predicted O-methyltransferase YrrM